MTVTGSSKVGAVIAAAGSSQRMNGIDKIFAPLMGRPLLAWVVEVFQGCERIHQIVLVLNQASLEAGKRLVKEQRWSKVTDVCPGGKLRQESVAEGLKRVAGCDWVVIHDGARPCISSELIERGLAAAAEYGSAIAALAVTDTIKVVGADGLVKQTPDRSELWAVQTPQVFRRDVIEEAYRNLQGQVSDDATLVERLGSKVKVFPGSHDNIKVTTPNDLLVAEMWLKRRAQKDERAGFLGEPRQCV